MLEELMMVEATIKAAEIQKDGMVYASIIGGLALGLGVFISWMSSLHTQREDRLRETRRDVYLDLVGSYSNMVNGFYILISDVGGRWNSQEQRILEFSHSIDRVVFICETKTKGEILKFIAEFKKKYIKLHEEILPILSKISDLESLNDRHIKTMDSFDFAAREMDKMELDGVEDEKTKQVLSFMKNRINKGEEQFHEIELMDGEITNMLQPISKLIETMVDELNTSIVPIVHSLRSELGAKTDIKLENSILSEFKNN